jgi:hypothetical protein
MAHLFPLEPDPSTPASERKLRERLRDGLPANWIVLHSKRFLLQGSASRLSKEGEADFLVIDPSRGYLVLEVKGGGVGCDADGWYSIDRAGVRHKIKDPGRQATEAVHSIDRYLSALPWFRENRVRVPFGWGVAFPDVEVGEGLGPDYPPAVVIDKAGTRDIRSAIDRMFSAWMPPSPLIREDALKALVRGLAPSFQLVPALLGRIEEESETLLRLTDEQMEVLDFLESFHRVAIDGPAGSGKTLLAMEKARRFAEAGRRVLFLCFNRPLADHLAVRAEGFTVKSFHAYCREVAESAGVPFRPPKGSSKEERFWDETAPEKLVEALDLYPDERFDAVVVDEGQDFQDYWWIAVEKLLRDPRAGALYVFHDPWQNLFGGGPVAALDLKPVALKFNCRNTAAIARFAYRFVDSDPVLRRGAPEGMEVEEVACGSPPEIVDAVRKTLHRLIIEERLPNDRVVVLTPRALERSDVWRQRKLGSLTLVEHGTKPGANQVVMASLQRYKGLEADAVVLCEVEDASPICSPKHLYVAASRAKHVLIVIRLARR